MLELSYIKKVGKEKIEQMNWMMIMNIIPQLIMKIMIKIKFWIQIELFRIYFKKENYLFIKNNYFNLYE